MSEGFQSKISIYNISEMDIDWNEEEDERLRVLVILKREKNWEKIAKDIGRTPQQCKSRWKHFLSPSIIKVTERRKWVPEEDEKLTKLVKKYGTKNWRIIASHLRGRLPKQCRERWINHLDPNIVKGRLTDTEWNTVLEAHDEIGNRWSEIAKLLPGRTPNQIKNHWHATIRKTSKRKSSDLFFDEDRFNENYHDTSSDSFAEKEPFKFTDTYKFTSMSDPNLNKLNILPGLSPELEKNNTLITNKKSCFTPDIINFKRKKMKVNHHFSKLDALVHIAECMYQSEVEKSSVFFDVDSKEGSNSIFKFLDDPKSEKSGNVTMKDFEFFKKSSN
jgi:hypothetical protein